MNPTRPPENQSTAPVGLSVSPYGQSPGARTLAGVLTELRWSNPAAWYRVAVTSAPLPQRSHPADHN